MLGERPGPSVISGATVSCEVDPGTGFHAPNRSRNPRFSQRFQQRLNTDSGLAKNASQSADRQGAMQRYRNTLPGFDQPHVRTALARNGEATPARAPNNRRPRKITGKLHAATKIGSLVKWRRSRRGTSSSPK